jgi:hypothetical protein
MPEMHVAGQGEPSRRRCPASHQLWTMNGIESVRITLIFVKLMQSQVQSPRSPVIGHALVILPGRAQVLRSLRQPAEPATTPIEIRG